jgi:3-deoxy-manno-octulosonate cytidylyltransferase (CMP-KDO synthetase)
VLLRETGRYLVQHVYERALRVPGASRVLVAADDPAVAAAVESFGGRVVMTSTEHASGTDRVAEAAREGDARWIVNLQADEPEIEPADVSALIEAMRGEAEVAMGTLVHPVLTEEEQNDPSVVKAVLDAEGWAVDFRREPTPGGRRHLGIYAFEAGFLQRFTRLGPTARETERRLEQMRALDHGVAIRAVAARHKGVGIDTPADYEAFVRRWRSTGS